MLCEMRELSRFSCSITILRASGRSSEQSVGSLLDSCVRCVSLECLTSSRIARLKSEKRLSILRLNSCVASGGLIESAIRVRSLSSDTGRLCQFVFACRRRAP